MSSLGGIGRYLWLLLALALPAQAGYAFPPAPGSPREGGQTGKIISVRKLLREQYFVSRYPQIHYYTLYVSLRIADTTYCAEYETPVLDEIDDVQAANGKEVEVAVKDKKLTIRTPKGRTLKTRLVEGKRC
jgi:hypothetical protein